MDSEIDALVTLSADENLKIAEEAQRELVARGATALPAIRALADSHPLLATRLSQQIEGRVIEDDWRALSAAPDFEEAALLINRWYDPLLDPAQLREQLDALAAPLHGQFDGLSARQGAVALRDWLSGARGFRGNNEQYYAPENSMFSYMLRTKHGLPLTLSMLYLAVARRCGAPLYPIGIPSHFIVRYGDGDDAVFLDPFHKGVLLTRQDVQRFLVHQGVHWTPDHLEPMAAHPIVARMLRNVVNAYAMHGDAAQTWQVLRFLDLWMDGVGVNSASQH